MSSSASHGRYPPATTIDYIPVAGDIADADTARRAIDAGPRSVRTDRHADQQRRHLHRKAVHGVHGRRLSSRSPPSTSTGFFHITQLAIGQMVAAAKRTRRQRFDLASSINADSQRPVGAARPHQGWAGRGQPVAGDRIRLTRGARERRLARRDQDTGPRPGLLHGAGAAAPARATSARSATSSTRSSISSARRSSRARRCMWTAARRPGARDCDGRTGTHP